MRLKKPFYYGNESTCELILYVIMFFMTIPLFMGFAHIVNSYNILYIMHPIVSVLFFLLSMYSLFFVCIFLPIPYLIIYINKYRDSNADHLLDSLLDNDNATTQMVDYIKCSIEERGYFTMDMYHKAENMIHINRLNKQKIDEEKESRKRIEVNYTRLFG